MRAARDFAGKKPEFSAQVALFALSGLLHGAGYDPDPANVRAAYDHLVAGAGRMGTEAWAHEQVTKLVASGCSPGREHIRQSLVHLLERCGLHKEQMKPATKGLISGKSADVSP